MTVKKKGSLLPLRKQRDWTTGSQGKCLKKWDRSGLGLSPAGFLLTVEYIRRHSVTDVSHLKSHSQFFDTENLAFSVLQEAICFICNFYPGIFSPGRGAFGCLFSSMKSLRALLHLLLCLGPLVVGEVCQDFSKCLEFFYKQTPPTGFGKSGCKYICQRYHNHYHFASLYDQLRRIPIYSAYKLNPLSGKRPRVWKYEPQVFK